MDFDKLQQQWAGFDHKLESALTLNASAVRTASVDRMRRMLGWHKMFVWFELLCGVGVAGLLGDFSFTHWGEWQFVLPSIVLHVWTVAGIIYAAVQLTAFSRLDYTAPISAIHAGLQQRARSRVRFVKGALASGMLLWVLWIVVGLKGIWNVDLYAAGDSFIVANLAFSAVVVGAISLAWRPITHRFALLRRMEEGMAGRTLRAALEQLRELAHPEPVANHGN
jgi:hypothetical protein